METLCREMEVKEVHYTTLNMCICCYNSTYLDHRASQMVIDNLMTKLDLGDEVLDKCNSVFNSSTLHQYFKTELNKLCLFIRTLFIRIKSDGDYERGGDREIFVLKGVERLVQIHEQHSEKDKIAADFLNNVLVPLCALVNPTCEDNSNRIGAKAQKCVQQILFAEGRYQKYKDYSQGRIEEGSLPAKFFPAISRLVHGMDSDCVVAMLSCLFGAAVASYKHDSTLVDIFFRRLVDAAGDLKTEVLNSLMKYLMDIPLDFENKIDDISLTDYLGNLIDESIIRVGFRAVEYSLLGNTAWLNPRVFKNRLPKIFKRILLAKRETEFEVQSYDRLMIAILYASSKLEYTEILIVWLLLELESALRENKDCRLTAAQILPIDFCSEFAEMICGLQSPQITSVLGKLSENFKLHCVEEYEKESTNQVRLLTDCTMSVLVSILDRIHGENHTAQLALQQTFVTTIGDIGESLSTLSGKLTEDGLDNRIIVGLFRNVSSLIEVQSQLKSCAPNSNARDLPWPISEDNLTKLISIIESLGDNRCRNAANKFLLRRIELDPERHEPREKLTGMIGGLEASWRIIIQDYPSVVLLLDFDQLSQLVSLILEEVVAEESGLDKWGPYLQLQVLREDEKFNTAILCHAFTKIGTVIKDYCTAADIISRIDPIEILKNETQDAAISLLNRRKPIKDVVQLYLSSDESTKIQKCLKFLYRVPLTHLGADLRTMVCVMTYVISREFKSEEGIASLCDKILSDTLGQGGINVFPFIDLTLLMSCLPGSKVLEKVFAMSLTNAGSFSEEDLAALENCPEKAIPTVLSCIRNVKPNLNNECKRALNEVEKELRKRVLSNSKKTETTLASVRRLTRTLQTKEIQREQKKWVLSTLRIILMEINSPDENQNSKSSTELIEEVIVLVALALKHRIRLPFSEELYKGIWKKVFNYSQTKLLPLLLEATPPTLFQEIIQSLLSWTERDLQGNDVAKLRNTLRFWNRIVTLETALASKCQLNATCDFLQSLLEMKIGAENWPDLIELSSTIVTTKHIKLTRDNIDLIVLTAFKSLREGDLPVCEHVLELCLALLRSRSEMMTNRLPKFLKLYRQAIVLIKSEANKENTTDKHCLARCARNVEKVSNELENFKSDKVPVSPHVIANLVNAFGGSELQPALKQSFANALEKIRTIYNPRVYREDSLCRNVIFS